MFKAGITENGDGGLNQTWRDITDMYDIIIVITKAPHLLLKESIPDNVIIHCTITGLGNTIIEPNVINRTKAINAYHKLVDQIGEERCILRIDPIFCTPKGIANARKVYSKAQGRVRISFFDSYNHVNQRFIDAGIEMPVEHRNFHADLELRKRIYDTYFSNAEVCGEPGFNCTGCISMRDINAIGINNPNISGKCIQRVDCQCIAQKTEILPRRNRPCTHNCIYCYWK